MDKNLFLKYKIVNVDSYLKFQEKNRVKKYHITNYILFVTTFLMFFGILFLLGYYSHINSADYTNNINNIELLLYIIFTYIIYNFSKFLNFHIFFKDTIINFISLNDKNGIGYKLMERLKFFDIIGFLDLIIEEDKKGFLKTDSGVLSIILEDNKDNIRINYEYNFKDIKKIFEKIDILEYKKLGIGNLNKQFFIDNFFKNEINKNDIDILYLYKGFFNIIKKYNLEDNISEILKENIDEFENEIIDNIILNRDPSFKNIIFEEDKKYLSFPINLNDEIENFLLSHIEKFANDKFIVTLDINYIYKHHKILRNFIEKNTSVPEVLKKFNDLYEKAISDQFDRYHKALKNLNFEDIIYFIKNENISKCDINLDEIKDIEENEIDDFIYFIDEIDEIGYLGEFENYIKKILNQDKFLIGISSEEIFEKISKNNFLEKFKNIFSIYILRNKEEIYLYSFNILTKNKENIVIDFEIIFSLDTSYLKNFKYLLIENGFKIKKEYDLDGEISFIIENKDLSDKNIVNIFINDANTNVIKDISYEYEFKIFNEIQNKIIEKFEDGYKKINGIIRKRSIMDNINNKIEIHYFLEGEKLDFLKEILKNYENEFSINDKKLIFNFDKNKISNTTGSHKNILDI